MPPCLLIAEDDSNVLDLLAGYFSEKGYVVHTAQNGQEALNLVKQVKPDVLISDVMMPVMNGFQLVRELSQNYDTPMPRIILLTSRADSDDARRGLNIGADVYISKPFQLAEVAKHVEKLLNRV
jgi:DNA-binding response OmpR family regulator